MLRTSLIIESQTYAQIKKLPIAVGALYDNRITRIVASPQLPVKSLGR